MNRKALNEMIKEETGIFKINKEGELRFYTKENKFITYLDGNVFDEHYFLDNLKEEIKNELKLRIEKELESYDIEELKEILNEKLIDIAETTINDYIDRETTYYYNCYNIIHALRTITDFEEYEIKDINQLAYHTLKCFVDDNINIDKIIKELQF